MVADNAQQQPSMRARFGSNAVQPGSGNLRFHGRDVALQNTLGEGRPVLAGRCIGVFRKLGHGRARRGVWATREGRRKATKRQAPEWTRTRNKDPPKKISVFGHRITRSVPYILDSMLWRTEEPCQKLPYHMVLIIYIMPDGPVPYQLPC